MRRKYTNEYIDNELIGRNIIRLSDSISCSDSINWQCLVCGHIWTSSPKKICQEKRGCRKCAGCMKLTNEEVDRKILNKNIQRISDYINRKSGLYVKCLTCNHSWKAYISKLFSNNEGCAKCSKKLKLINEDLDLKFKDKNIKRISNYVNRKTKLEVCCLICNYSWKSIIYDINNCPSCDKFIKLTNENVDTRLVNRNIKRIDDIINNKSKIKWQCNNGHIWEASPGNILRGRGCPNCKHKNQKIVYDTILKLIECEPQKFLKKLNSTETKDYRVDFYIPKLNCCIEYNGHQHFFPVRFGNMSEEKASTAFKKQQERDQYVRDFCKNNKIELIEIDGREYTGTKLEEFVKNIITKKVKNN